MGNSLPFHQESSTTALGALRRCLLFSLASAQEEAFSPSGTPPSAFSNQLNKWENHMFSGDAFVNMYHFAIEI
jgi:hypothetical protein